MLYVIAKHRACNRALVSAPCDVGYDICGLVKLCADDYRRAVTYLRCSRGLSCCLVSLSTSGVRATDHLRTNVPWQRLRVADKERCLVTDTDSNIGRYRQTHTTTTTTYSTALVASPLRSIWAAQRVRHDRATGRGERIRVVRIHASGAALGCRRSEAPLYHHTVASAQR